MKIAAQLGRASRLRSGISEAHDPNTHLEAHDPNTHLNIYRCSKVPEVRRY